MEIEEEGRIGMSRFEMEGGEHDSRILGWKESIMKVKLN